METARTMSDSKKESRRGGRDGQQIKIYRRMGLLNGLLIGLALAASVWLQQVITLAALPVSAPYGSILLTGTLIVILSGLLGWGSARIGRTWATMLIWLVGSVVITLLVAYQPNRVQTFLVWMVDRRFWGRLIYPLPVGATFGGLILSGFFVILVLELLAILQDYRLENTQQALGENGRMTAGAIVRLIVLMPLVVIAGLVTGNAYGSGASTKALQLVHEAIRTGRAYEGDLFELSLEQGINYSAIQGVRDQMSADYTLMIGDSDPVMATMYVIAQFDNGAWINCRVLADQLNFCYDAAPPYTVGLSSLITGEPVPEECRNCVPQSENAQLDWLRSHHDWFGQDLQISRLAQWGRYVLMQVSSESSGQAVECWFKGTSPVWLESCMEVVRKD
jgi:hypothetical protein